MDYKLEEVSGIGKATAEKIKAAGIDSIQKLASVKPEDLVKLKIKGLGKATAIKYIENAKKLIEETKGKEKVSPPKKEVSPKVKAPPKQKVAKKQKDVKKAPAKQKIKRKELGIKELIKKQAECNVGLVGHVDI